MSPEDLAERRVLLWMLRKVLSDEPWLGVNFDYWYFLLPDQEAGDIPVAQMLESAAYAWSRGPRTRGGRR